MNKPAVIASALAIAAVGYAIWERVEMGRMRAALADLDTDRSRWRNETANLKERLDAAHQRVVQAELQAAALKEDLGQLFSKKGAAGPALTPSVQPQSGFAIGGFRRSGSLLLRSPPAVKALDTTYHVLYRQLKLSPAQIERFKAIMTDAAARFEELEREANRSRVSPKQPPMQARFAQTDTEVRQKLTAELGPDALPLIDRFTETLFLRDAVAQVATELFYTNDPLTEPQANELVDVLAKNMRDPAGRLNSTFADATAMKADAAIVLSLAQLGVWREFIDYLSKTSFASLNRPGR